MSETRNIVIIGGASAGLGAAHAFLKHSYEGLKASQPSTRYVVHVIEPSTHYWWRISAPRSLVEASEQPHDRAFLPIANGFTQYDKEAFKLHQATASSVDTTARTVTFEYSPGSGSKGVETLHYYALIIATGSRTPSKLTTIYGTHDSTIAALDEMNKRLATATSVIIGGGGPIGVEAAGEIGEHLNGVAGWFQSRPATEKAKITLISGSDSLLPAIPKSFTPKTEKFLNRVGVDVIYKTRIEKVELSTADAAQVGEPSEYGRSSSGKTVVHLSTGQTMECDVYIPAVGTKANTEFLPKALLNDRGFVKTDPKTLRVPAAGERVYAVGDCGDYSTGGFLTMQSAVPVVAANLAKDLEGAQKKDKEYSFSMAGTQLVPVGKGKGITAIKGFGMPSAICTMVKGKDYMISNAEKNLSGAAW